MRSLVSRIHILIFLSLICIFGSLVIAYRISSLDYSRIIFLNIGQGDSSLILTKTGSSILIDCGSAQSPIMDRLYEVMGVWRRKIDLLIITHGDSDHFGGCRDVIKHYQPSKVIINGIRDSNNQEYLDILTEASLVTDIIPGFKGTTIKTDSITLNILHPSPNVWNTELRDDNDQSIVIHIASHRSTILLTGDISSHTEMQIINQYPDLKAQILKAGHHGSNTSTSQYFLEAIRPQTVIISAGEDNPYNHPAPEVVDRIRSIGSEFKETKYQNYIEYPIE